MDAKEVERERGDNQEWRNPFILTGLKVIAAQPLHGLRSLLGRSGDEPDLPLAAGQDFDDLIVSFFPCRSPKAMPSR
ncbi:MAG: hypothetical protein V3T83_03680, partial [Acidobacteriota bacterium]